MIDFKKINKIKGKTKGSSFKETLGYVQENEGSKGMKLLAKELKKNGLDEIADFKNIKSLKWYPLKSHVALLLIAEEIFKWNESNIFQMGYNAAKRSIILKILIKYFTSIEKAAKKSGEYWRKIYSVGDFSVGKLDIKNKEIVLKLENFNTHPITCIAFMGYIKALGKIMLGTKNIKVIEKKCIYKGDAYHEYVINW